MDGLGSLDTTETIQKQKHFVLAALCMPQTALCYGVDLLTLIFAGTDAEARPGVMRLIDEAREAGIKVAVCSAATKSSVIHVVKSLLGDERFEVTTSFSCVYASQHLLSEILFAVTQRC